MPSEKDQTTAMDNMYGKFVEIWTCVFFKYASGQTDKQTYSHSITLIEMHFNYLPKAK